MSGNIAVCTMLALCTVAAGATTAPEEELTYAERLGWPHGAKVVIFHVDDAGMSYDSDRGAIQALEEGVATSTSVMMPCPWVPHIAAYLKDHPQTDAGLHLTLTSEWDNYRWGPVVGQPVAPGLVDPQGYLWQTVQDVLNHATVEEFEKEIRAQIDKARAVGITPTHLDSHMGTCFYEPFIESYVKVGIEKKIPVLMIGGHMQYAGPEVGRLALLLRAMGERIWKAGLPVIDDVVTQPTNAPQYEQKKQQLLRLLTDMKPGITEIIVHCTAPTEVFARISSSGKARAAELRLMLDPDLRSFLKKEGIVLTTWRELKQRRAAAQD
ncbi:MAG: polysaccharide deacetylase family protein [Phycisphaerae bacterium]|nr:polysaccharide deacetylase family protein [Phycisphaerae bacterium]